MIRPPYEALDRRGIPEIRPARVIGELPTPAERSAALIEAGPAIAARIGIELVDKLKFGQPVFCAFKDMTRAKSRHHADTALLLTAGRDVSLDFCPSYAQPVELV